MTERVAVLRSMDCRELIQTLHPLSKGGPIHNTDPPSQPFVIPEWVQIFRTIPPPQKIMTTPFSPNLGRATDHLAAFAEALRAARGEGGGVV